MGLSHCRTYRALPPKPALDPLLALAERLVLLEQQRKDLRRRLGEAEEGIAHVLSEYERLRQEAVKPEKPPEREKDPAAVALGRRGGLKGGKKRMEGLTPEERAELGRKAAAARWTSKETGMAPNIKG